MEHKKTVIYKDRLPKAIQQLMDVNFNSLPLDEQFKYIEKHQDAVKHVFTKKIWNDYKLKFNDYREFSFYDVI